VGVVYRAKHGLLRRPTAIKLLPAARAGARAVARFEREVQLTATLSHPNTITVFDYGRTPDGTFYYAMELLDGETLQDIVTAAGPMSPSRVVHVLSQVAGALAEAHDAGLVHRDVKPANVVLCQRGGLADVVKVVDFGIVRDRAEATATTPGERTTGLLGTPYYISPEGIMNASSVTASSDLYALGALAYFLLTGAPPFPAGTLVEVCAHHVQTEPTPPSERAPAPIPDALERLVLDCLAKKPEDRPASARAVGEALASCGVPAWSQSQARVCWAEQGEKIREARSRSRVTNTPDAMAVSLEVAAR
jgi:serine/threonine-protein kinase